jgi:hypothetical protein
VESFGQEFHCFVDVIDSGIWVCSYVIVMITISEVLICCRVVIRVDISFYVGL